MDLKDWLAFHFQQERTHQLFWNIHTIVTIGVVGFAVKAGDTMAEPVRWTLALGFLLFAAANLIVIRKVLAQLRAIRNRIREDRTTASVADVACAKQLANAPSTRLVTFYHVLIDVVIATVVVLSGRVCAWD